MVSEQDKIAKEQKAQIEELENSYSRLFHDRPRPGDAKAVIEDLINQCYIKETTYVGGCPDASDINEGCRKVFLHIAKMVRMEMSKFYLDGVIKLKEIQKAREI